MNTAHKTEFFMQILALMALRQGDSIMARYQELIRSNIAISNEFFARWDAVFEWHAPLGASVAFPRYCDISYPDNCLPDLGAFPLLACC